MVRMLAVTSSLNLQYLCTLIHDALKNVLSKIDNDKIHSAVNENKKFNFIAYNQVYILSHLFKIRPKKQCAVPLTTATLCT